MLWPWLSAALAALAAILLVKIILLHKTARALAAQLRERLPADTNAPLTVSAPDRAMEALADALNTALSDIRAERRRLQNGDRLLRKSVTGLSHDLRTPLTAIRGYAALLRGELQTADGARYLDVIERRAAAMQLHTDTLFQYAVAADAPGDGEPVELSAVLQEGLAACYTILTDAGIAPEITLPDAPVTRVLDRAALLRILENILTNAARYSGGDLRVSLSADGEMRFQNRAPNLSAVEAEQLFDRFFTVETGGGTGLGLSIARDLSRRMGGEISAAFSDGSLILSLRFN